MRKTATRIIGLSLVTASMAPLSCSAFYIPVTSYEVIQEQLSDYTYITEFVAQENVPNHHGDYQLYMQIPEETGKTCGVKIITKENYDVIKLVFPDGNAKKLLSDAIQQLNVEGIILTDDDINCEIRLNTSKDTVKELYTYLNEQNIISEFVYTTDLYSLSEGETNDELLGEFGFCTYDYSENKWTSVEEQIEKYEILVKLVNEHLPDSSVELDITEDKELGFTAYHASVIPSDIMTIEERIEFALKFKEETGIFGGYYINELVSPVFGTRSVDFVNALSGDANDDGKLALSDAIAILQTVGNPDTYGLTAQGEYNADIAGDFDCITNADALAVQKKLLNIE